MNRRSPRLSICLPLLASLALPASLAAQESSRPAEDQPAAGRQTSTSTEPGGRDSQPRDDSATTGRTPERGEILAEMRDAEKEHRERVAAINRLRQLARDEGRNDRQAELDGLEARENARHQSALRNLVGRLGDAGRSAGSTVCDGPAEQPSRS